MKRWLVAVVTIGLLLGNGAGARSDAQTGGWTLSNGSSLPAQDPGAAPLLKGHPKIASRVTQMAGAPSALAERGDVAQTTRAVPGFVRFDQQGRLEVYILLEEVTESALAALRNAGVEIEIYDPSQRLVQGWIPPAQLQMVADLPVVRFIDLPNYGVTNAGSVATQGDGTIQAAQMRGLGTTGSGIKVGVISDGIGGLTSSITSGDLPAAGLTMPAAPLTGGGIALDSPLPGATVFTSTPVGRADLTSGSEGSALLEIIHDIAPNAQLFFAPGGGTTLANQRTIRWLKSQGVKVIADDLAFLNVGPYDGTSVVSQELSAAVAGGVSYFVSVGNYAQQHYRGLFTDTDGDTFHEFDRSLGFPRVDNAGETLNVTVQPGAIVSIRLQWNDSFGASTNDYDLCVHDPADIPASPVFCSPNLQTGTQNPTETLDIQNIGATAVTLGIRINRFGVAAPRVFDLFIVFPLGGGVVDEFKVQEGSVPNKADAGGGVISVGAVNWQTPNAIEFFSSRGPTSDGRLKPELVAPDRVSTSVPGFSPFFGTSASAPHVAGLAALLLGKLPNLTPGQLRAALLDATLDLGQLGPDNTFGHGRSEGSVFTRIPLLRLR